MVHPMAMRSTELPGLGYSVTNSLSADNTTFSVMGSYTSGPVKILGGYQHMQ
jgi:hypothetical protein